MDMLRQAEGHPKPIRHLIRKRVGNLAQIQLHQCTCIRPEALDVYIYVDAGGLTAWRACATQLNSCGAAELWPPTAQSHKGG